MQFLLLICADPTLVPDDAFEKGCEGWTEEMQSRAVLLPGGAGLRTPAEARTVRVRRTAGEEEVSITDGPYAETKELIGGLVMIECESIEEATKIAAAHPSSRYGAIEVRPLYDPTDPNPPW
jgi:hypothetical protein